MITLLTSHVSPGGVQSVAIKSQSVPLVAVDGNHYKGLERQEVAIAIVLAFGMERSLKSEKIVFGL